MSFPTPEEITSPVTLEEWLAIVYAMIRNTKAWPIRVALSASEDMEKQIAQELVKSKWCCRVYARYIYIEPMKG